MNTWIFIILTQVSLVFRVDAAPAGSGRTCTDTGAWVAGGLVSCSDLANPNSPSGINKRPKNFCDQHWNECCSSCNLLFPDATKAVVTSTPTPAPVNPDPPSGSSTCTDTGAMVADGVIPCSDLTKPNSASGINKNPRNFCDRYWNECCSTCSRLFPDATKGHYTVIVTSTPTPAPVKTDSPAGSSTCTDTGPIIADGLVSCNDLRSPNSATGIGKNPENFCKQHWKECCKTCSDLFPNGFTTRGVASSTSLKPMPTTSTPLDSSTNPPTTTSPSEDSLKELLKESNAMLKDVSYMLKNIFGLERKDSVKFSHKYALFVSDRKR